MPNLAGIITVVCAFTAALLLLYASFDQARDGKSNDEMPDRQALRKRLALARDAGMCAAGIALVAAYVAALF